MKPAPHYELLLTKILQQYRRIHLHNNFSAIHPRVYQLFL